jgi:hypothetical protein
MFVKEGVNLPERSGRKRSASGLAPGATVGPLRWDFQLRYRKHFRFIPVIIPFTQPDHHIGSFPCYCSNGAPHRVFPTEHNDLPSFQVKGHWSDLRCQGRSIITMEKTFD